MEPVATKRAPKGTPASAFAEISKSDESSNTPPAKRSKVENSTPNIALRRAKEQRKREKKKAPQLKLQPMGEAALLTVSAKERKSIHCADILSLVAKALFPALHLEAPMQWCFIGKKQKIPQATVLIVDGLTLSHFSSHRDGFPKCRDIFLTRLDTMMPLFRRGQVLQELTEIPLSNQEKHTLIKKHGSVEKAAEVEDFLFEDEKIDIQREKIANDTFSRLKLLLSPLQMVVNNYPLPTKESSSTRNYVFTKDQYAHVTEQSPMFAMDCEMVKTSFGFNEVVRISIVNENCESIYETFVRPQRPVIDYRTDFSGITAEIIESATKTLKNVQDDIRSLLPADAILVGHSLNADLKALRMIHPYVIDTSIIYNAKGDRKRSKLRELAKMYLEETIQWHPLGHDSIEDSQSCMKLVKKKLSQGIHFGDRLMEKLRETGYDIDTLGGMLEAPEERNISINLLGYLLNKNRDAKISIVASESTSLDSYEQFIPKQWRESERITVAVKKNNKAAVKKTCKFHPDTTLRITHLAIEEHELTEDKVGGTLENVDQWIYDIWTSCAVRGLCVVIFSGSRDSRSGLSFAEFRKVDFLDPQKILSS